MPSEMKTLLIVALICILAEASAGSKSLQVSIRSKLQGSLIEEGNWCPLGYAGAPFSSYSDCFQTMGSYEALSFLRFTCMPCFWGGSEVSSSGQAARVDGGFCPLGFREATFPSLSACTAELGGNQLLSFLSLMCMPCWWDATSSAEDVKAVFEELIQLDASEDTRSDSDSLVARPQWCPMGYRGAPYPSYFDCYSALSNYKPLAFLALTCIPCFWGDAETFEVLEDDEKSLRRVFGSHDSGDHESE